MICLAYKKIQQNTVRIAIPNITTLFKSPLTVDTADTFEISWKHSSSYLSTQTAGTRRKFPDRNLFSSATRTCVIHTSYKILVLQIQIKSVNPYHARPYFVSILHFRCTPSFVPRNRYLFNIVSLTLNCEPTLKFPPSSYSPVHLEFNFQQESC